MEQPTEQSGRASRRNRFWQRGSVVAIVGISLLGIAVFPTLLLMNDRHESLAAMISVFQNPSRFGARHTPAPTHHYWGSAVLSKDLIWQDDSAILDVTLMDGNVPVASGEVSYAVSYAVGFTTSQPEQSPPIILDATGHATSEVHVPVTALPGATVLWFTFMVDGQAVEYVPVSLRVLQLPTPTPTNTSTNTPTNTPTPTPTNTPTSTPILPTIPPRPTHTPVPRGSPPPTPTVGPGSGLSLKIRQYLAMRAGSLGVAVYNRLNGHTVIYNGYGSFVTASSVKVGIMCTVMHQAIVAGRGLTSYEQSLLIRMIDNSDNDAAQILWDEIGYAYGFNSYMHAIGLYNTYGDPSAWGLSQTTATDQVLLVRELVSGSILNPSMRSYALRLMENVESDQAWGVSAGPDAAGANVALKNGWLPLDDGWHVNSEGWISGAGRNYVITVLTDGQPDEGYAIATIETVSRLVWSNPP